MSFVAGQEAAHGLGCEEEVRNTETENKPKEEGTGLARPGPEPFQGCQGIRIVRKLKIGGELRNRGRHPRTRYRFTN